MNKSQAIMLVEFNTWADRHVLGKAARLPPVIFDDAAPLGHRTALATLVHIVDTQWYWREGAQFGVLPVETLTSSSIANMRSLRRRWDDEDRLFLSYIHGLTDRKLAGTITYSWPRARPRTRPLWQKITHIVNHATQHRSELAMFVTTRNLSPGNLDFITYAAQVSR